MKIAYLFDSSSGIKEDPSNDIYVLKLSIIVNNKDDITLYQDDNDKFNLEKLCALQGISNNVITTSQSPIGEIGEMIKSLIDDKKYHLVISIPISSGLSRNFEAINSFVDKYPNELLVLDARTVQTGIEWLFDDIREFIKNNPNFTKEDIKKILADSRKSELGVISVGDCTQLVRGGRLSALKGIVIKMTKMRLLIVLQTGTDGKLEYADKAFSDETGIVKMFEIINKKINFKERGIERMAYLSTILDQQKNERVFNLCQEKIKQFCNYTGKIVNQPLNSTIAVHTGMNTYAVYIKAKRS